MLEIIGNIIKFIFSKDFRETTNDVFKLTKSSDDWRKDMSILTGKFTKGTREQSGLILSKSIELLKTKKWSESEIKDVRFIYNEIVTNAFEHGIASIPKGKVKIKFILTTAYVKLEVTDNGNGFDLNHELQKQGVYEKEVQKKRGLSFVCRLTPEISQLKDEKNHTIIVFRKQGIRPIKVNKIKGITVFNFEGTFEDTGHYWNQFMEKISLIGKKEKIIINFGTEYNDALSRSISHMAKVFKDVEENSKAHIAVCGLANVGTAVEEYFQFHFKTFDTVENALDYLT